MKPGMKMLMMDKVRQNERYPRSEYSGGDGRRMIGYDRTENAYRDNEVRYGEGNRAAYGNMERGGGTSNYGRDEPEFRRRRDDRGRYMEGEGWQGNRGYPRSRGYEPEARRRRDSRGRYMMGGMRMNGDYEDDDDDDMRGQTWFPPYGYMPPQNNMMRPGNSYGDVYAHGTVYAPGAMNKPTEHGSHEQQHYGEMDEQTARHWVRKMRNADGTPSPHWQPEQVEPLRMQHCPECGKWEFWACMNMMYADYCATAKKMGVDKPEFYAGMAKAFLEDEDAKDNKLMRYMRAVAE